MKQKRSDRLHRTSIKRKSREWYAGGVAKHGRMRFLLETPCANCQNPLCCGNPRKMGKLTTQEKKFKIACKELD